MIVDIYYYDNLIPETKTVCVFVFICALSIWIPVGSPSDRRKTSGATRQIYPPFGPQGWPGA